MDPMNSITALRQGEETVHSMTGMNNLATLATPGKDALFCEHPMIGSNIQKHKYDPISNGNSHSLSRTKSIPIRWHGDNAPPGMSYEDIRLESDLRIAEEREIAMYNRIQRARMQHRSEVQAARLPPMIPIVKPIPVAYNPLPQNSLVTLMPLILAPPQQHQHAGFYQPLHQQQQIPIESSSEEEDIFELEL